MAASTRKLHTFDVYVGNLPPDANERNIGKLFIPFGEIAGISVKSSTTPKNKKFAFVQFLCEPDADRACKELNKKKIDNNEIVVRKSENSKRKNVVESVNRKPSGSDAAHADSLDNAVGPGNIGSAVSPISLDLEGETVMVIHVESTTVVWVHTASDENTTQLYNIQEQLVSLCPAGKRVTDKPDPNKVYGCLYTEDEVWYRCKVKQCFDTDQYEIVYIDYGNTEVVSSNSLVEIPQSLANIKGLAVRIELHNTRTKDLSNKQGIQYLKDLTLGKMAHLVSHNPMSNGSKGYYGTIFVGDINIAEAMIKSGFCYALPAVSTKVVAPSKPIQPPNGLVIPAVPPMMDSSRYGFNNHSWNARCHLEQNILPPFPLPHFGQLLNQPPMTFSKTMVPQDSGKEKKLQSELTKMRHEVEKIRNEKDAASMQVEFMKTKVKTLQDEFAKLQDETLSKRIDTVISLAGDVRRLRTQFPTKHRKCFLEEAIAVCTDSDRVDNSRNGSLIELSSSLARYTAAHDEIRLCKDQVELLEIIDMQNNARRGLYRSLTRYLQDLQLVPLRARVARVQDIDAKLVQLYGEYLDVHVQDCPNIEHLIPGFRVWKSKKDAEFKDIRTATDYCEEALQTALSLFGEKISLEERPGTESSNVNIDQMMKTYAHALQREFNATNLVLGKDASLVAMVIKSVRKQFQNEISACENYTVVQKDFLEKRASIEPWLENTPNAMDLLEIKKTIRSLKSKLRHILADKLDLEESGTDEELESLKGEEEKIRTQLQAALADFDKLQKELAILAETHFPELAIQCPELCMDTFKHPFDTPAATLVTLAPILRTTLLDSSRPLRSSSDPYILNIATARTKSYGQQAIVHQGPIKWNRVPGSVYKGLVKANREFEHYSLKPAFRTGAFLSTFNREPILLELLRTAKDKADVKMADEFNIGGSEYSSKEEFMKQLMQYNGDTNFIQAVFFSKTERHAYVESAWEEGYPLDIVSKERQLMPQEQFRISLQLVQTVANLHKRGFIHGEVTPQNVLLRDYSTIVLMYPDFSKSLSERCSKRYVTENGLVFQSPELQYSSVDALGKFMDVYNLVLLIYMIHCPTIKQSTASNSTDIKAKIDPSLQFLFDAVLSGKTSTRITAEQVLQLDYFAKSPMCTTSFEGQSVCMFKNQVLSTSPQSCLAEVQLPVLKGIDEPMEIGVFRSEDYETTPILPAMSSLPPDTDSSWTECSLSTSSNSRCESPLDTAIDTVLTTTHSQSSHCSVIQDVTSQPQDMASQSQDMTSQSHDMTSQSHDVTSQSQVITSQSQVMLLQSQDMTLQSQEMTAQSQNLTSQSQDMMSHYMMSQPLCTITENMTSSENSERLSSNNTCTLNTPTSNTLVEMDPLSSVSAISLCDSVQHENVTSQETVVETVTAQGAACALQQQIPNVNC